MIHKKIILSLLELRQELNSLNVMSVFLYLGAEFTVTKKYCIVSLEKTKYLLFKNNKENILCYSINNFNELNHLKSYRVFIKNIEDLTGKTLAEHYTGIEANEKEMEGVVKKMEKNNLINVLSHFLTIEKKHSNKNYPLLKNIDLFDCRAVGIPFGLFLYGSNGKSITDVVYFSENKVKYAFNNPISSLKINLRNISKTKSLSFVFNPIYLMNKEMGELTEEPIVLLSNKASSSHIDETLFETTKEDKDGFKDLSISILCKKNDELIGVVQLTHYLINLMVDYIHFNLEEKSTYIIVNYSWKAGEGVKKDVRKKLSITFKNLFHEMIFEENYKNKIGVSKNSENIDLLLNIKHKIVKRQSFVNKKKDVISYKIEKNSLSLYAYCKLILSVLEIKNVAISNCLKNKK